MTGITLYLWDEWITLLRNKSTRSVQAGHVLMRIRNAVTVRYPTNRHGCKARPCGVHADLRDRCCMLFVDLSPSWMERLSTGIVPNAWYRCTHLTGNWRDELSVDKHKPSTTCNAGVGPRMPLHGQRSSVRALSASEAIGRKIPEPWDPHGCPFPLQGSQKIQVYP